MARYSTLFQLKSQEPTSQTKWAKLFHAKKAKAEESINLFYTKKKK